MWWKNLTLGPSPKHGEGISVPSPGQCGGKTASCEYSSVHYHRISVPSPGQCGGKTSKIILVISAILSYFSTLSGSMWWKNLWRPRCTGMMWNFSTLSGSMWWKNHRPSLQSGQSPGISVPSPGQCGGKTPGGCYYPRGHCAFSTLSGSMWWKNPSRCR